MAELAKKKLINEYDRNSYSETGELVLDNGNPVISADLKNSNIPSEILATQSIDGIVTDPENRTLWINGMPFGNAYANPSDTGLETGPFHSEIFNDFETNSISTESNYAHVEGRYNSINGNSTGTHVEGGGELLEDGNVSTGSKFSHIEGTGNRLLANSDYSHAEGTTNQNLGAKYVHAEGVKNTIRTTAEGAHIEGINNEVYNAYEHAEGQYNWSELYSTENGGDTLNRKNTIVSTVGVGSKTDNSIQRKNAIRINADGAVYLSEVTKVTDRVVETFNPCNYTGQSIYKTNAVNNNKREIQSKSVQEILSGIGHLESMTYWKLRNLAENKKLLPGKSYRITDYRPGLNELYNKFDAETAPLCILSSQFVSKNGDYWAVTENDNYLNRFDIIVTAVSESEFSDIAKAVAHNYYPSDQKANYFAGTDFNNWTIYYDFFSSDANYDWVNPSVINPVLNIVEPTGQSIFNYCNNFFQTNGALGDDFYKIENDSIGKIFSKTYYISNGDDKNHEYFKLISTNDVNVMADPGIATIDGEEEEIIWGPVKYNALSYSYDSAYYYSPEAERNWENNPGGFPVAPPKGTIHSYNHKWTVNIQASEEPIDRKNNEFCLLTNEADFSYISSSRPEDTNILFCKNDKKLNITNDTGYYTLYNYLPYVIAVEKTAEDLNTTELVYSAFIYGGPYLGPYNQIPEAHATQDRWYILHNYNPQDGIYTVYPNDVGTISFLVNRTNANIATPDFNDWSNLQQFAKDNTGLLFYKQEREVTYLGSSAADLLKNTDVELGVTINSDTNKETQYIKYNGETYERSDSYKYEYDGKKFIIWTQSIDTSSNQDITSFVISNDGMENTEVTTENIINVYIVYLPVRFTDYGAKIQSTTILEYFVTKINDASHDGTITISGDSMNFAFNIYKREDSLEYNNNRYFVSFGYTDSSEFDFNDTKIDTNEVAYKQYRVTAEYTLNADYTQEMTTKITDEGIFTSVYYAEAKLIPITYVQLSDLNPYVDGKYNSTGVIYRLIDEFGNDCPYDFKNIKFYNGMPIDGADLNLCYSYTFDGVINSTDADDNEIENPYTDITNVGDISIIANRCSNNKIKNTITNQQHLNPIFFRLSNNSSIMNNTFIDCKNIGSMNYSSAMEKGSIGSWINNTFKECSDLDIIDYSITNSYFYNCSCSGENARLNGESANISNSTLVDTIFDQASDQTINIINSQVVNSILSSKNNNGTGFVPATINNSQVFNNSGIDGDEAPGNQYNVTELPGIYINQNLHTISGNSNGFNIINSNNFDVTSAGGIQLEALDGGTGFITLKPTATGTTTKIPQLYANSYTQTMSYNYNAYVENVVSVSRDSGSAGKTFSFTYEFNKHTFNNQSNPQSDTYYPTSGYGYSFPKNYYTGADHNKLSSPTENYENKIKLGMFYINSQWNMYTWAWQSNAVRGLGKLEIIVEVKKPNETPIKRTFTAGDSWIGGYWSEKAWSTKSIYSYINFDTLTDGDFTKLQELGFDEDHSITISEHGKLLIESIKFTVTTKVHADSTGANDCIGNVWVSNLYHQNSNTTNTGIGYDNGVLSGTYQNTTIKYYKPSRYLKSDTSTQENIYIFAKDGLIVKNGDTSRKYVFNADGVTVSNG
jgi:hypothetical protein